MPHTMACYDRGLFQSYSEAEDRKVLLGDSHSTNATGIGEVVLKFTSGKTIYHSERGAACSKNKIEPCLWLSNQQDWMHSNNMTLCELTVDVLLNSGGASFWWGEIC